ncbi:MAG: polysaccharide biosynthesis tyrosine autokinase [Gemmatimonadetes bacterium]|nr:polysaccharide biosynthesis tyrosine autokinase [Gemmatimonadota bacterium]
MTDLVRAERRGYPAPPMLYSESRSGGWRDDAESAEESIHLREVLAILRRHVTLIVGIAAVVLGLTAYAVLRQAPEYRASGLIRLADVRRAMTGGIEAAALEGAMGRTTDPLLSQIEVLKGREVLGEVVDREGLRIRSLTPDFPVGMLTDLAVGARAEREDTVSLRFAKDFVSLRAGGQEARAPYGSRAEAGGIRLVVGSQPEVGEAKLAVLPREVAINDLARTLVARPKEKTDAVVVEFTSEVPQLAQRVVNTTIEVFQAANARAAQQASRRRRIFLEEQLRTTDSLLTQAQLALGNFRSRERVFSSRGKFAAQQEGLLSLQMRREELAADRQIYQSMLTGLSGSRVARARALRSLASYPGIASNPAIAQLYTQLSQYESARDSLTSGSLGSTGEHPDVERLNLLVASTEAKAVDAVRSHVAVLDARIAALDGLEARNSSEIQTLPTAEAEEQRLVQQVEGTLKITDQVREELQRARMAEAVEAGQVEVVYRAPVPTSPVGTGSGVKLTMGLILGLMVGGAAAFVREQMNTAIRRSDELEQLLHVPGLAVIPPIHEGSNVPRRLLGSRGATRSDDSQKLALATVSDLRSSGAEAYRTLRTNLLFSQAVRSLRTLLVTSTSPSEGKSTTASNLAVTYAQQGVRVLLVDCDLRKARLHKVFGVVRSPGLTELLLGHAKPAEVLHGTQVEGLSFLAAGTLPPNPAELLGGGRMRKALEGLSERFDIVIIDAPPLLAASDAAILGTMVDGVLMVVRAGKTERGGALKAMQQLRGVGANVVGAVLNDPDSKAAAHGEYTYYEYYGAEA